MRNKVLLLVFALLHIVITAKAEYFNISDYNIAIKVFGGNASFTVEETIVVDFTEPRHGIFRNIPYKYRINGEEIQLKIYDVEVDNFKFDTYTEGSQYVIKIGSKNEYVQDRQVYKLRYKVKNAWIFTDENTEFYWNLVGTQWPVSIDKVNYTVLLDESIAMDSTQFKITAGANGSQDVNATINYYINQFTGNTTRKLEAGEGVTIAINLPKAYVKRPTEMELLWAKYGFLSIGILFFGIITSLFYRTWSKYGKEHPIVRMVQYTIPKNITPAEAGVIIDEKADNIDILCLLPYWAHNGNILIKKIPVKWGKDDHELIKVKDLPDSAFPFERIVFDGLFKSGNTVLVSSLEQTFYEYLNSAKSSLKTHLNNMGIYYPVSVKMQFYSGIISFVILVLGIVLGIVFQSIILGLCLCGSSILGFVFANYMLKKNELGIKLYQEIIGFKMFVKAAEKDKIERMLKDDPEYFEKTLPYAMIFGYAKQWSKKFEGLLIEPPKWYVGPTGMYMHGGTFSPSEFGASFNNSITDIQSAFTSMPESSGGGGGFSGGSVGGGFGGGGGGSW